jgi:hypothetical protein
MCRSIKTLRDDPELTPDDVEAAALQFVRKVSGYRKPSRANQEVFDAAVAEITATTERLLENLVTRTAS